MAGAFLSDQATHLAQTHHSPWDLTELEFHIQEHRWLAVASGYAMEALGFVTLTLVLAS